MQKRAKKRNYIEIPPEIDIFKKNGKEEYFYVDRPETPKYQPLAPKINKETQIERNDEILFSFDHNVGPLLEIIVPKVISLAETELLEERFKHRVN